jgi:hypothetical protein
MGLSTFGPNNDAPASFHEGFITERAESLIMWKCNSFGAGDAKCSFNKTAALNTHRELQAVQGLAPFDQDGCNKYPTCHTCINATTPDGLQCGWCLGGTLDYKDVGNTTFKCGGYKEGTPNKFTCPADFRTSDCSGFVCNFTTHKCTKNEAGEFPTEEACNKTCSMVA